MSLCVMWDKESELYLGFIAFITHYVVVCFKNSNCLSPRFLIYKTGIEALPCRVIGKNQWNNMYEMSKHTYGMFIIKMFLSAT